jgi:hypothetical protein
MMATGVFTHPVSRTLDYTSNLGDLDDVRAYGYKAERAAALVYAHFKNKFESPKKK